uniref:phage replisome organizer N-terminal domain-containing protein n=1 Tax=Anaerococcus mediterraneensis TaxID=1870984 RepID=UPI0009313EBA|nr:phage replisome organizer N-terminal domain-containing protein [Anaerococcus mediterraneensis]
MGDNKRYYWLKLPEDFYDDDTIQWIEDQENGAAYVNFYLKLLLKSLSDDGRLIRYVGQRLMPYDVKSLARLTNTDTDTVRVALELFVNIGLVERLETGELYMNQINEMIGRETESARRKRRYRARKALEGDRKELPSGTMSQECETKSQQCPTDNRDKIIDKEIEKEIRDDNNIGNLSDEEKRTIDYYYRFLKNNTSRNDKDMVVQAIKDYGWKRILYTLWYLKYEQRANVTSFKYVDKVLANQKDLDPATIEFISRREIKEGKDAEIL